MDLLGKSRIGTQLGQETGIVFYGSNPATGERLDPPYYVASREEADAAARLAAEAFPIYRKQPGAVKAVFLRRIAEEIEALGDTLIERVCLETALPRARVLGERGRTTAQLRMFADLVAEGSWVNARIDRADPARTPAPKQDTRLLLQALGPVAVFGPSNFPLAFSVAGGDTSSALAAGCPVVVKAHPSHPGTSELVGAAIGRAVRACGLPEGVFSLLFDAGNEVSRALVTHPAIKAVGFTGSRQGGIALVQFAAARPEPIPVFAEMSSLNPVFLLPGALRERGAAIAEGLAGSVTLGVGQFCTNPGLVIVEQGAATEQFAEALRARMALSASGIMLSPGICRAYEEGQERLRRHPNITTLALGQTEPGMGNSQASPALFGTDAETFLADPTLAEEVFGPATLLLTHGGHKELLRLAHALPGSLTATVHGCEEDFAAYQDLIALLETKVGRLIFNGYPTGVEVCASMNHGGPSPATTDSRFTSVGTAAIYRFARPVCYQDSPQALLPPELQNANPEKLWRLVDDQWTQKGW